MTIQILLTAFSLFVIARALRSYRRNVVRLPTFLGWTLFWMLCIFLVWQPDLTNRVAAFLQVGRGADAIVYLSLIVIFYLFFKLFTKLESIDQELTTLIREIALIQKREPKK